MKIKCDFCKYLYNDEILAIDSDHINPAELLMGTRNYELNTSRAPFVFNPDLNIFQCPNCEIWGEKIHGEDCATIINHEEQREP